MRTRIVLGAVATLAAAFTAVPGCASTGTQRSERFADDIHGTVAAVDAHGSSRRAAFDSMGVLVSEPHQDLAARFGHFDASVSRVVASDGALRDAVATMKASANDRFQAWGRDNITYGDAEMQVRAQQSRADAAERFRKAVVLADAMLDQSAGLVTYLSDFRRVLSNDLSAGGVAGASDFATKATTCNGHLDEMAGSTRESLGAAADAMTSGLAAAK
jgi:hypothetical protein